MRRRKMRFVSFRYKIIAILSVGILFLCSCSVQDLEKPGNIVPPTAELDPALPHLVVEVGQHKRKLHLQTFGDPQLPPVFVLPGGPGADFRLLLPLKILADSFFVVMWDPRGAGLSERVPKEELTIQSFIEEIQAVKASLAPGRPVRLIGHSYGGLFLTRYTAENPSEVSKLILIEPGAMDPHEKTGYNGGAVSFLDGQSFFWTNELLTSSDHAAADYKAIDLLPKASRNFTCNRSIVTNYPMWRFGAYQYYILQKNAIQLPESYKWSRGIERFNGDISIIAGTCGAASENFQRSYNLPHLSNARLKVIPGAGHISLFTDYKNQLIDVVRSSL